MRIAWFSPLPPMQTGIADYSFELLPLIAREAQVDVFCPRPRLRHRVRIPRGVHVIDPGSFPRMRGSYDSVIYHLGNNPFHSFVYRAALETPGVAVFHDTVLHHLLVHLMVENGSGLAEYERLMEAEYGQAGVRLADLRIKNIATDFEKFLFPLSGHVARASRAIVAHNEESRERLAESAPDVPSSVIPLHAGSAPAGLRAVDRAEARSRLGLPPHAFIVGHFGFITAPKQPGAVVGGFAEVAARRRDALLVMVGADHTRGGLAGLVDRHGLRDRVRIAGFVDLPTFYLYLRAVDAVVNLRYPAAGESSATLARALGEGRASIVSNLPTFSDLPADVVLKADVDSEQARQVGAHLVHLSEDPAFRVRMEDAARAYAHTVLDPATCAELYLRVAEAQAGFVATRA